MIYRHRLFLIHRVKHFIIRPINILVFQKRCLSETIRRLLMNKFSAFVITLSINETVKVWFGQAWEAWTVTSYDTRAKLWYSADTARMRQAGRGRYSAGPWGSTGVHTATLCVPTRCCSVRAICPCDLQTNATSTCASVCCFVRAPPRVNAFCLSPPMGTSALEEAVIKLPISE